MKYLIVLLALSFQVHAESYEEFNRNLERDLPQYQPYRPIEVPEYQPEPRHEYLQESDADWSRSVQLLDLERLPRR